MKNIFWAMKKTENGFTLVELLWVISIMTIVILAIYAIFESSLVVYRSANEQIDAQRYARNGLLRMSKNLRQLFRFIPSGEPYYKAGCPGDYQVIVESDIDGDGIYEYVYYHLDGTDLIQEIKKPTATTWTQTKIASYVRNETQNLPIFAYKDTSGTVLGNLQERESRTRRMVIRLVIDVNPATQPPAYDLSTDVTLRNRD